MRIVVMTLTLHAPWVQTLKEKRMEVRSLVSRLRNKFNVSACETGAQDKHQLIEITVAAVAADPAQGDSILDHVLRFVEGSTEAMVTGVQREAY